MNKKKLIGVLFVTVATFFGIKGLNYEVGTFAKPGPGLFPLIASILLFAIGIFSLIDSFLKTNTAVDFKIKNILIVLLSLIAFVLATQYVNFILGIIFLISISSFAAKKYSIMRVVKIVTALSIIILSIKYFLNVNLLP
jgi:Tripartite tricarboxylate transporter TctB family